MKYETAFKKAIICFSKNKAKNEELRTIAMWESGGRGKCIDYVMFHIEYVNTDNNKYANCKVRVYGNSESTFEKEGDK